MFYVYAIVCFTNLKKYIGKTNCIKTRFARHKRDARNGSNELPKLYRAIRKYGEDNFYIGIIESFNNEQEAYDAEYNFIKMYSTQQNGYNCSAGGWGTGSGPDCYWFGKHHTEETKQKISKSVSKNSYMRGRAQPEKVKRAVSNAMKGSKNHRSKLSEKDVEDILCHWISYSKEQRDKYGFKSKFWRAHIKSNYNIQKKNISDILRGKRWKHVWDKFSHQI